jgi:hypothetical protein
MLTPDPSKPPLWLHVPMGPKLAQYLGVTSSLAIDQTSRGTTADAEKGASATTALVEHLREQHASRPDLDASLVVDLLDELVTMALPEAALDLARAYPQALQDDDFRAQLALGVGSMMHGDLALAESALTKAQNALPNEPAPYVNLVQIFRSQDRAEEAEVWCLAGIEAEVNNHRLWELLAVVYRDQMGDYMPEQLLKIAEKKTSWAGTSLATSLISTGDRYLKSSLLEKYYFQGERDPLFLIELTGAYGIAGNHEKIPPIVWQAEHLATKGLPWQLHVHAAQAQLVLGNMDEFHNQLRKARLDPFIPDEAMHALQELEADGEAGILQ